MSDTKGHGKRARAGSDPKDEPKVTRVDGGRQAREVAEQKRIDQLGGKRSNSGSQTSNKVNPIGPKRQSFFQELLHSLGL
jgi:hypothetical protein